MKFESWEEFTAMAGYIPEIDPKVSGLKEVIGSYREPEYRTCYISSSTPNTIADISSAQTMRNE